MAQPRTILVAKALVLDESEHCLMLRRSASHPSRPLKPDLPGGLIDEGESPLQAVCREIAEETGLQVPPAAAHLLFSSTDWEHDGSRLRFLFAVRVAGQKPPVQISWEHDSAEWVLLGEMPTALDHPVYAAGLQYILKHKLLDALLR